MTNAKMGVLHHFRLNYFISLLKQISTKKKTKTRKTVTHEPVFYQYRLFGDNKPLDGMTEKSETGIPESSIIRQKDRHVVSVYYDLFLLRFTVCSRQ